MGRKAGPALKMVGFRAYADDVAEIERLAEIDFETFGTKARKILHLGLTTLKRKVTVR